MPIRIQQKTSTGGIKDLFTYSPSHADWIQAVAVPANGILSLPVSYMVGKDKVTLIIDGISLTSNNFSLMGTSGASSNTIKMLFPVRKGAECSISITGV